jgi:REP element-mobilizing transposase RayT
MSVREKIFVPNQVYFLTFTILAWRKIFTNDKYCSLVYKWFDYAKENYGNRLYGYAIMPNHIHCLLLITDKSPVPAKLIQNAKRFLAYQIVRQLKADGQQQLLSFFAAAKTKKGAKHKIFENNYDILPIQSRKIFLEKLNYIHNNPCQEKWSLTDKPETFKYSSAANYFNGQGVYEIEIADF